MNISLKGPFFLLQRCCRCSPTRRRSVLCRIGPAPHQPAPTSSAYAASKARLLSASARTLSAWSCCRADPGEWPEVRDRVPGAG